MRSLAYLMVSILVFAFPAFAGKEDYVGFYWNEEKDGIVRLVLADNSIEGITVWGKNQSNDIHNPDPALQGRSLRGIKFLWGFSYNAKKDLWSDGKVYDPKSGKTYDAKMSLEKGGRILKMRGYMGVSMFGRTARFERVNRDNIPEEIKERIKERLALEAN